MPYITLPVAYKGAQITFDDILEGLTERRRLEITNLSKNTYDTKTFYKKETPKNLLDNGAMIVCNVKLQLKIFCEKYQALIKTENKAGLYHSFLIPKASGGMRKINAPEEPLMSALRELKSIFETRCYTLYHTSAFAYIRGRNAVDAVRRHQQNQSRWFLKLDFHDFFGSTTMDFVLKQLKEIYPYNLIIEDNECNEYLRQALSLCFLDGGLPQGTPISPMLTNLIMIPIDHRLAKMAREDFKGRMVYTRYADDILISSSYDFKWKEVEDKVVEILNNFGAPFQLNKKKTRYGSSSGANWNLGVMLNEHNQITIGQKRKKYLKVMLYSFFNDYKTGNPWTIEDAQVFDGQLAYYKMVEKENIENIVKSYETKFNMSFKQVLRSYLHI